jgi:hypothetical protein
MSSPLVRNLFHEFVNWRPRYTKEAKLQKCKKCGHEYYRHTTMFPTFINIFLDADSDSVDNDELDTNGYTYCYVGGCKCKGFEE